MEDRNKIDAMPSYLLTYLDIATKFRNHEFNIQILRNIIFTSAQAVMFACYAATVGEDPLSSLAIAFLGIVLSILWFFYYRASLYWAWFWEHRCRIVNDKIVKKLGLDDVNIFRDHPIGKTDKPPAFEFAGKKITWIPVHTIIRLTQVFFCVIWLLLVVVACKGYISDSKKVPGNSMVHTGSYYATQVRNKADCEVLVAGSGQRGDGGLKVDKDTENKELTMTYVNITLALVAILSLLVNLFLILQNQRNFERNFETEYRPYVFMEEIDANFEPGGLSRYDFKVINRGKTPARITSSDYQGEKDKIIGPGQIVIRTYNLDNPQNHILTVNIYYSGTLDKFKNKKYMSSFEITHTYKQKPAIIFSTFT